MRKDIVRLTETDLKNIIKATIKEALEYNKTSRSYEPKFTGKPHSDSNSLRDFYGDGRNVKHEDQLNFDRNDYRWSDPTKQEKFERLQLKNNVAPGVDDSYREEYADAENYREDHRAESVIDRATEETAEDFHNLVRGFLEDVKAKYPVLKNYWYMLDFVSNLQSVLEDFRYK